MIILVESHGLTNYLVFSSPPTARFRGPEARLKKGGRAAHPSGTRRQSKHKGTNLFRMQRLFLGFLERSKQVRDSRESFEGRT